MKNFFIFSNVYFTICYSRHLSFGYIYSTYKTIEQYGNCSLQPDVTNRKTKATDVNGL